ncbi:MULTISPECIES: Nramp family divalent metal transporter [Comamonas]|uniref:Nramp family divalent metal transporter n=1 Tax=Comamonas TaxID=283 RepID=UPI000DE79FE3|nr:MULTISPECIES: Nramp family divalent metal transporter [Comamonas]PWB16614.1 divalent metal cation transporter [Comamonas sp. JNW]
MPPPTFTTQNPLRNPAPEPKPERCGAIDPDNGKLGDPSLPQVHRSIAVPRGTGRSANARRMLAFAGPGYLVAVGYMDPGNWATSIAGGSQFGYSLLAVIFASNLMAMLFQAAAVRLGLASGRDLAQACREQFAPRINLMLWFFCEIAIVACNLAEVLGMAIGLNLLFGLPLIAGVCITVVDVMLILALQSRGFRALESVVIGLVALIGICFGAQLVWLHPPLATVLSGFIPRSEIVTNPEMLYLAVGIVGATVMPHNLYLHSAIVQTREHSKTLEGTRQAIRFATIDSTVALGLALFVNAAILVVAAGAFNRPGTPPVTELSDAYHLLSPVLGVGIASAVFGTALLASGLSSSVTGTLAGQIVMEGFLQIRLSPSMRALLTRLIAIVPAVIATAWYGSEGATALLVFSQVVLSMQLPFAIVPLLMFTTRRHALGALTFGRPMAILLWSCAAVVVSLNLWMLQRLFFATAI